MLDIIAGEKAEGYGLPVEEVYDVASVPEHVSVVRDWELDTETYGEDELSELELLSVALQDAMDAQHAGQVAGPVLDEVALRRAERRARRADAARVLRTRVEGAIA